MTDMQMMNIKEKLDEANARSKDFARQMTLINERLLAAKKARKTLKAAMKEVEAELLELLGASVLTS